MITKLLSKIPLFPVLLILLIIFAIIGLVQGALYTIISICLIFWGMIFDVDSETAIDNIWETLILNHIK